MPQFHIDILIVDDQPKEAGKVFEEAIQHVEKILDPTTEVADDVGRDELDVYLAPPEVIVRSTVKEILKTKQTEATDFFVRAFVLTPNVPRDNQDPEQHPFPEIQELVDNETFLEFDFLWVDLAWGQSTRDGDLYVLQRLNDSRSIDVQQFYKHETFAISNNPETVSQIESKHIKASVLRKERECVRFRSEDIRDKLARPLAVRLLERLLMRKTIPLAINHCANRGGFVISGHDFGMAKNAQIVSKLDATDLRSFVWLNGPECKDDPEKEQLVYADLALHLAELKRIINTVPTGEERTFIVCMEKNSSLHNYFLFIETLADAWQSSTWKGKETTREGIRQRLGTALVDIPWHDDDFPIVQESEKEAVTRGDDVKDGGHPETLVRNRLFKLYLYNSKYDTFDTHQDGGEPNPASPNEHNFSVCSWLADKISHRYRKDLQIVCGNNSIEKSPVATEVFVPRPPFLHMLQTTFTDDNFVTDAIDPIVTTDDKSIAQIILSSSEIKYPRGKKKTLLLVQYSTKENPAWNMLKEKKLFDFLKPAAHEVWLKWCYQLFVATGKGATVGKIYQVEHAQRLVDGRKREIRLCDSLQQFLVEAGGGLWDGVTWVCVVFAIDGEADESESE